MNISFENPDKVNGLVTITVEEADFKDNVEKTLKDYRKKANVPGFRPGMVPMGLIKKQYGAAVKVDVVNRFVGEQIYKYIKENNIQMLGEPLPSAKQEPVDIEKDGPYTFMFDVAVAPELDFDITEKTAIDYYHIKADDKLIDQQVDMYASRQGQYVKAESYDPDLNDLLRGDLRELDAEGNTVGGGITVEGASMMPQYIKVEDQKKLFEGAKPGDIITFNPRKAYPESDAEVSSLLKIDKEQAKDMTADFSYQITEISRYQKAEVNQELFDSVLGKDAVDSIGAFRQKVAEMLDAQFVGESDFKFLMDVRENCEKQVGELTYPDEILKRVMLLNNKEKGEDYVEKNYAESIKQLTWHLIKEKIVGKYEIKINDDDVKAAAKEAARMQFAQYGMNNVPDEYLENYAAEMMKKGEGVDGFVDRAIDRKLIDTLKGVVKLNEKTVTFDEFNELLKK